MSNTTENPNEETIKCVVVGDNNVGKTKLIFARAYKKHVSYSCGFKLGCSHVPTVFAIDEYRNNKEVLQNARCVIDGTVVSLRLWDTFGDHNKNRKFAYGKADVVVICFSICDKKSLQQVLQFWRSEVQTHCKGIPVIIVGCKVDLRYTDLGKINHSRSFLSRPIKQSDIIFPEQCRAVAAELNCPYYESSVLDGYGVRDVFENVCRAALLHRRSLYFWNTGLRRILRPVLQQPLEPPKPTPPTLHNNSSMPLLANLSDLFHQRWMTDVVLRFQGGEIKAHKVILSAASNFFHRLFTQKTWSTNSVDVENVTRTSQMQPSVIEVIHCKEDDQDLVYLLNISPTACRILVEFCYIGSIALYNCSFQETLPLNVASQLLNAGQRFELPDLIKFVALLNDESPADAEEVTQQFLLNRSKNLKTFQAQKLFVDVMFLADDGFIHAHKIVLASGCDVMNAMFAGSFIESENKEVVLPGTTVSSLQVMFEFIYTSELCSFEDCLDVSDLISLANRMCLSALVSCTECSVAEMFTLKEAEYNKTNEETVIAKLCEDCITIFMMSQIHNATRLKEWCLHFLSVHYNDVCRYSPKYMKALPPCIQCYLQEHRWPPVWYIKQKDFYEKSIKQRKELEEIKRPKKLLSKNSFLYLTIH